MNLLVWSENRPHPDAAEEMYKIYPKGIHEAIKELLSSEIDLNITTATMADVNQGLSEAQLNNTDVLIFWSHLSWRELEDARAELVRKHVLNGMGLIVLHSGHASKVFSKLMGTGTRIGSWKENGGRQRYWIANPSHPIVKGLPETYFDIPQDEAYSEYFEIPQPNDLVFITNSEGGEAFRSGCCWQRDRGRIFYFQGGHETYPVYYQKEVQQIIKNAVRWVCPQNKQ